MLIHDPIGDTIDTREEANRPGPFGDGLSVVLHFSDFEDEFRGDFTVYGTGRRFGRRILWCDTQGFMQTSRYHATEAHTAEEVASHVLNDWADEYDEG